jgi:hypothetical protein
VEQIAGTRGSEGSTRWQIQTFFEFDRTGNFSQYWGEKAAVRRSSEDRPGPTMDQEFGEFETWPQANMFAARLNEGLEIPRAEAEQIITGSILRTGELLRTVESPGPFGEPLRGEAIERALRLQFMLAELELRVTFCRIARSKPSENTDRLLGNARNALFDAMRFVCHSELADCEVEAITGKLAKLHAAFEESLANCKGTIIAAR